MNEFNVDTREFDIRISAITDDILDAAELAINDAMDDLVRISSQIAPIDKDVLRKSHERTVTREGEKIIGEVSYSAAEGDSNGRFNYALAMHEWIYTPSQAGSFEGYFVGRKYLERPLMQESDKYKKWIADEIKGATE
jgi:hypothetical protein